MWQSWFGVLSHHIPLIECVVGMLSFCFLLISRSWASVLVLSLKYDCVRSVYSNLNKLVGVDLGPNQEFYPLQGQCYDFTDRE